VSTVDTSGAEPENTSGDAGGADADTTPAPAVEVLDCRGMRCPLPVIKLARRLPEVPVGTVVRVLADDPAAAVDIPAWCRMREQEFLGASHDPGYDDAPAYDVRRRQ
jgi:Predicted redox protein, regulator of disulfide bond formation